MKMAEVSPCSTRVLDGDGLVERLIFHHVEDRRERFLADDRHVGAGLHDSRLDEEARAGAAGLPP